jgi:hypothetical protein
MLDEWWRIPIALIQKFRDVPLPSLLALRRISSRSYFAASSARDL